MNEELQGAISSLIEKTLSGVDASQAFLSTELPDYIYQLLMWYGVYNFILTLIGVLLIVVWLTIDLKLFFKLWPKYKNQEINAVGFEIVYCIAAMIPRVFIVILSIRLINLTWLQIWIAPKVWLIEYASSIIK